MSNCTHCGCGPAACGCCAGIEVSTPRPVGSPPGQGALSLRIGRHGDFMSSMLAGLSLHVDVEGNAPLKLFRTREKDDLTISLLDAFAASSDVLSFYNERIGNEGYLPTATEFRSVEALAGLVGYQPQPGVAASVFLAFDIDSNSKEAVRIDKGLGVRTVPGQDELPQIFETSELLEARAEWNEFGIRKMIPQIIDLDPFGPCTLWLSGTDTNLSPGDALLIEPARGARPVPVRVIKVITDRDDDRTEVRFERWALDDPRLAEVIKRGFEAGGGVKLNAVLSAALEVQAMPYFAALDALKTLAIFAREQMAGHGPEIQELLKEISIIAETIFEENIPNPVEEPPLATFADRLETLARPPAAAPRSREQILRRRDDRFRSRSAASLAIIGKAVPAAAAQLERAVAGHVNEAPGSTQKVYAMRVQAGVFGRGFPKRMKAVRDGPVEEIGEWPIITRGDGHDTLRREKPGLITLDGIYEDISPQSWLMVDMRGLEQPSDKGIRVGPTTSLLMTRAMEVIPKIARGDYGGSGECTAIRLASFDPWIAYTRRDGNNAQDLQALIDREFQLIRRTTVYAGAEELRLAEQPIVEPFCLHKNGGLEVELDSFYPGLEPGRYVIVSGERTDIPDTEGILASEVAMIAEIAHDVSYVGEGANRMKRPGDRVHTFITLTGSLSYCYKRSSVVIRGNVVKASHGETRKELLGGGDASKPGLILPLKQAPLTFIASPNARGVEASLEIWVDDVRWSEAPDLLDSGPTDRVYRLQTSEAGKAEIQFGDGREGARPSTGAQNIQSVYRIGIGRPGNARAGQISQLVSRPAGLQGVINPLPASGGADPEDRDQVRRNAPLATMGLDRLVSVEDHASFARNFAGIAKARARMMTDSSRRLVHLTIAGEDDAPIDETSDLMIALKQAMIRFGDPFSTVIVAARELRLLIVAAQIKIERDRLWDAVVTDVRRRLAERFGFERREIASGLAASAVLAVIQATPGVAYVDLDTFGSIPTVEGTAAERSPLGPVRIAEEIDRVMKAGAAPRESAAPARIEAGGILAAELLLLAPDIPDTLILNELT